MLCGVVLIAGPKLVFLLRLWPKNPHGAEDNHFDPNTSNTEGSWTLWCIAFRTRRFVRGLWWSVGNKLYSDSQIALLQHRQACLCSGDTNISESLARLSQTQTKFSHYVSPAFIFLKIRKHHSRRLNLVYFDFFWIIFDRARYPSILPRATVIFCFLKINPKKYDKKPSPKTKLFKF